MDDNPTVVSLPEPAPQEPWSSVGYNRSRLVDLCTGRWRRRRRRSLLPLLIVGLDRCTYDIDTYSRIVISKKGQHIVIVLLRIPRKAELVRGGHVKSTVGICRESNTCDRRVLELTKAVEARLQVLYSGETVVVYAGLVRAPSGILSNTANDYGGIASGLRRRPNYDASQCQHLRVLNDGYASFPPVRHTFAVCASPGEAIADYQCLAGWRHCGGSHYDSHRLH